MDWLETADTAYLIAFFGFLTLIGIGRVGVWAWEWWRDRDHRRYVREHELNLRVDRALAREARETEARLKTYAALKANRLDGGGNGLG